MLTTRRLSYMRSTTRLLIEAQVAMAPIFSCRLFAQDLLHDRAPSAGVVVARAHYGPCSRLEMLVSSRTLSVGWGSDREDLCPCIVSTSWLWARGPVQRLGREVEIIDRLLRGVEALLFQGFDLDLQAQAHDRHMGSFREKFDVAGSAFAGPCSFALLTVLIVCALVEFIFSEDVKSLRLDGQSAEDDGKGDAEGGDEDDGEGEEEGGESESPVGYDLDMGLPLP